MSVEFTSNFFLAAIESIIKNATSLSMLFLRTKSYNITPVFPAIYEKITDKKRLSYPYYVGSLAIDEV